MNGTNIAHVNKLLEVMCITNVSLSNIYNFINWELDVDQ